MKLAATILAVVTAVPAVASSAHAQQTLDLSGVRLWLERADAIRGPEGYGEDNYYTSYQISSGSFRNFTSNACWKSASDGPNCTQALDGTAAWDATAPPTTVVPPQSTAPTGPPYYPDVLRSVGTITGWASCGQWLNSVISYGGHLYGFVHGEAPQPGQVTPPGKSPCYDSATHHKTMTLWTSPTGTTAGLQASWTSPTRIIDSLNGDPGQPDYHDGESGEGDCNAVQDSSYAYLFCRNPTSDTSTLARAPLTNLTSFIKYDGSWGSQPGINGSDTNLVGTITGTGPDAGKTSSSLGQGASIWADNNMVMLLGATDAKFVGLKASFTGISTLQTDTIGFTTLPDPLFVQETNSGGGYPYGSNPPHNLYIYPSVVSLVDGTRTWNLTQKNQFLLAYAFVPPRNDLSHRILATRSVTVSKSASAQDPQVLVALTTRSDSGFNQYYSSTQPVAYGSDTAFSYPTDSFATVKVDTVGYFVQLPADNAISQGQEMMKIVECRNGTFDSSGNVITAPWPSGHPDHLVTSGSCDAKYNEETVAGYSYPAKPVTGSSVEIYRCSSSANETHWVSTSSTCEGLGTKEKSLGWILTK